MTSIAYALVGENSSVFKGTTEGGDTGFYMGILDEIKPAGVRGLDEVKERISMTLARKDGLEISKKRSKDAFAADQNQGNLGMMCQ